MARESSWSLIGATGARTIDIENAGGGVIRLTVTEPAILERMRQVVDQSVESVAVLGIIVLIRVVLSFSLEVEIDGMWPWNRWRVPRNASAGSSGEK